MILVLLGAPGAGKGTQAVGIAERLGVPHVSTGDLFRANLAERTPLGLEAEGYMTRGDLVPDDVVVRMVRERLAEADAAAGAVLDGFPRTVGQAEALAAMLAEAGRAAPTALLLAVPRESLMQRLTGRRVCRDAGHVYHVDFKQPATAGVCDIDGSELYQRDDDTPATVANRLDVYDRETAPVIDYFASRGRLVTVDGDAGPNEVAERVGAAIEDIEGE
ncbi:MAG: adenylate kinase [Anaerolineae bacterium]